MSDERSLSDPTSETPVEAAIGEASSPEKLNPATFDFTAWLAGATPIRRSGRVYAAGALVAVCDRLADELDDLRRDHAAASARADFDTAGRLEDRAHELEAALEEARADYEASAIWWTVEGKSEEWVSLHRKEWAKANGRELTEDGLLVRDEDTNDFTLALIAGMTVDPVGVTEEHVRQLRERAPFEVSKLSALAYNAMNQAGDSAAAVTADFSLRPSTKGGRRAS